MALKVFFVDDDALILNMLSSLLQEDFQVETFGSARACIERLREVKPDIFLLDVFMPDLSGLDFCKYLKADFDYQDIPVIFMSGDDDIDTRMLCYEVGGEDFIVKPFQPLELNSKLKIAARVQAEKQSLSDQAGYATQTAMSAMTSMGELGVVMQALGKSFSCQSLDELGQNILHTMKEYGLKSAVQLRMQDQELTLSDEGHDVPLEVSVLNHARTLGRIFQFKSRCVFNFSNITLLINNMPLEDADRCGRIRDNVAFLVEGAEARLAAMVHEQLAKKRRDGIEEALPKVHHALDALNANYRRNSFDLTRVMLEYQEDLMGSFMHLGLTDLQEEQLSAMANKYMQNMVNKQDESLLIVARLEQIAKSLEQLIIQS